MTPEQARAVLSFLERVTLSPAEINAYLEIHSLLLVIAKPPPVIDDDE